MYRIGTSQACPAEAGEERGNAADGRFVKPAVFSGKVPKEINLYCASLRECAPGQQPYRIRRGL
jgi:hypothetical protein